MTATPVSAHISTSVTQLWNAHIKPATDARYYTKAQANARYYTRAQANARYLGANAKAADADELDGLDSTAFLPATGRRRMRMRWTGSTRPRFCALTGRRRMPSCWTGSTRPHCFGGTAGR
jgi:hypothetical protein